jgi:hypothetical protein
MTRVPAQAGHVGFVVNRVELGQVFSEYCGFLRQSSFHEMLHNHLSSEFGTVEQIVADVPRGLSFTPPHPMKLKETTNIAEEAYMCLTTGNNCRLSARI